MDFLIEPVIDTKDISEQTIAQPCCKSGSGCESGMLPMDLEEL
jgi:hypothetical protein